MFCLTVSPGLPSVDHTQSKGDKSVDEHLKLSADTANPRTAAAAYLHAMINLYDPSNQLPQVPSPCHIRLLD